MVRRGERSDVPKADSCTAHGSSRSVCEFDKIAACERYLLGKVDRPAFIEVPSCVLFIVRILCRHSVNRHNRSVNPLHRAVASSDNRAGRLPDRRDRSSV
jgi:hypothetical protein